MERLYSKKYEGEFREVENLNISNDFFKHFG